MGALTRGEERRESRLDLIGLDVSGRGRYGRAWISWPVIIAVLGLALGVAALRVDLIRMRYALADGLAAEQRLLEEQRQLTAEMRELRDPSDLAKEARALGFVHPERVIDLPLPADARLAPDRATLALGATRP
jgi:hypothetical protein